MLLLILKCLSASILLSISSVRSGNNHNQRSVINDDMYTSSQNHSQSSGYMSQHSSYNSLLE